jgi:hypothetical protein
MSAQFLNNILNLIVDEEEDDENDFNTYSVSEYINRVDFQVFLMEYQLNQIDQLIMRTAENESLQLSENLKKKNIFLHSKYSLNKIVPNINDQCIICMEKYTLKDSVIELDCHHQLHVDCCKEWITYKPECPICREIIQTV